MELIVVEVGKGYAGRRIPFFADYCFIWRFSLPSRPKLTCYEKGHSLCYTGPGVVGPRQLFIKQGLSYDFTPLSFAGLRFHDRRRHPFAYTWHGGMWREIVCHKRLFGNLILINMFLGSRRFISAWTRQRSHRLDRHGPHAADQRAAGAPAGQRRPAELPGRESVGQSGGTAADRLHGQRRRAA